MSLIAVFSKNVFKNNTEAKREQGTASKTSGVGTPARAPDAFKPATIDAGSSLLDDKQLQQYLEQSPAQAAEQITQKAIDRILAEQRDAFGKARVKLRELDKSPQESQVDMRSLRSQEGDIWGSVAPRPQRGERRDRSAERPNVASTLETAGAAKSVALRGTVSLPPIKEGRIPTPENMATTSNSPPSAEFRSIRRGSTVSSIDSSSSVDSVASNVSDVTTYSAATSIGIDNPVAAPQHDQQAEPAKDSRTRPPLRELYDPGIHTPVRGR
jgi:hypothetical protein